MSSSGCTSDIRPAIALLALAAVSSWLYSARVSSIVRAAPAATCGRIASARRNPSRQSFLKRSRFFTTTHVRVTSLSAMDADDGTSQLGDALPLAPSDPRWLAVALADLDTIH